MNKGIHLLIESYRREFRLENEGLYSEADYKEAERKYIKLRLNGHSYGF